MLLFNIMGSDQLAMGGKGLMCEIGYGGKGLTCGIGGMGGKGLTFALPSPQVGCASPRHGHGRQRDELDSRYLCHDTG